jgi:hypothetical protein
MDNSQPLLTLVILRFRISHFRTYLEQNRGGAARPQSKSNRPQTTFYNLDSLPHNFPESRLSTNGNKSSSQPPIGYNARDDAEPNRRASLAVP